MKATKKDLKSKRN